LADTIWYNAINQFIGQVKRQALAVVK
jgi:hypothetical protein